MSTPAPTAKPAVTRYHPALVALHWALALLIGLALVGGGLILGEMPNSDPHKIEALFGHMTVGTLILALMLVRLAVRLRTDAPPHADIGHPLANRAGRWAHAAFYVLVFVMLGSGVAMSMMTGLPDIVFFGSGAPLPESFHGLLPRAVHGLAANLLGLLVLAHVGAALYHQFVRRDGLMARMGFGRRTA